MNGLPKKRKTRKDKILVTPTILAQIESLSGLGLPRYKIAAYLGFSHDIFQNLSKEDPRVNEAIQLGISKAEASVTKAAYEMATSRKDSSMTKFWLKNRANWKEESTPQVNIEVNEDTDETKLLEILQKIAKNPTDE